MTNEFALFQSHWRALHQRVNQLSYSIHKNREHFPISAQRLQEFSPEQTESLDALILRYSQCVSMLQEQIFKDIALLEQEDVADKSNRDKAQLMEKLGAIKSAEDFGILAILRNKFAHHYPEETEAQLSRLNLIIEEGENVVSVFNSLSHYLTSKKIKLLET